jgi:hypothetical protein
MRVVIRIRVSRVVDFLRRTFTLPPVCGCGAPCTRVGNVWVCPACIVNRPLGPARVYDLAEARARREALPPFVSPFAGRRSS